MIKYISSWAEQIIIAVIIVTILEMILPKGNSKKYIKTIIGVYILYTIISPGIKLITGSDIKINYSDYGKYFNTQEVSKEIQTTSTEDTYKKELEKLIKSDIEKIGYRVDKVSANLDLDKGIIEKIIITIAKGKLEENNINISINKIDVGEKNIKNTLDKNDIKKITQKINENYGVSYENITINSI